MFYGPRSVTFGPGTMCVLGFWEGVPGKHIFGTEQGFLFLSFFLWCRIPFNHCTQRIASTWLTAYNPRNCPAPGDGSIPYGIPQNVPTERAGSFQIWTDPHQLEFVKFSCTKRVIGLMGNEKSCAMFVTNSNSMDTTLQ